ncbi:hypothetical protein [Streptomyces sp. NPDC056242]|uniref:hypothetical protein n=1 Tax=Streptomyces sp. NPDC056242 TaxID=3345760 RepID=UPI0035E2EBA7
MASVALVHCTTLMLQRLPEPPPRWLQRDERSFAYPYKEWRKPRGWCLTFFTDRHPEYSKRAIIGVGGAFPGRRSGTYERSLLSRDFNLMRPIPLVDLEKPMGASRRFLRDDGRMSEVAGQRLLECVSQLRPELAPTLSDLEQSLGMHPPTGTVGEKLNLEKDAVGMLLEAAGMERDVLEAWQSPVAAEALETRSVPFLAGLPDLRQIEDQQIVHDYHRLPGMTGMDAIEVGWRIYRRTSGPSGHRLFVYNANRHNVETITGVDMIYVNEFTGSVTTVQYKRMRQESENWTYWYDTTAERELERMAMVDKECEHLDDALDPRLVTSPSMVKLCRNVPFVMSSTALIPGMYLTRPHFQALIDSPLARGPRGGRRLREQDVPRYLNNTTFATLLKDGWLGTRGRSSDYIIDLILQALSPDGPGSVAVGLHRSPVPPGNRRTSW